MESSNYTPPFIEGKRRRSVPIKLVVLFFVLLVLIPLTIAGKQLYQDLSISQVSPTPAPTSVVFPTDTPTPIASPTATLIPSPTGRLQPNIDSKSGLDKSKVTILVENGSGRVGAANKAAQILKAAGYIISGTKNADRYDYLDVTVSVKTEKSAYLPLLKNDLGSVYTVVNGTATLEASAAADVIVIVGK